MFKNCIPSYIGAFFVIFVLDSNGRKVCCNDYFKESPENVSEKRLEQPLVAYIK